MFLKHKFNCFVSLRLFLQVHRDEIQQLPEGLAGKAILLPELLRNSRADSTDKKYTGAFVRFQKWVYSNNLGSRDVLPAKPFVVAIYLASLIQSSQTPSPVISAFYAIKWFHDINGLKSPTESKLVCNILEAAKRRLSRPKDKKEPITSDILLSMYKRLYSKNNFKSQRIIVACLIAYAGFFRSSELLDIRVSDIVFSDTHVSIFIENSKTDQYRDGAWSVIAKTGTVLCPVENLKKLIEWGELSGNDYVFCNITSTKLGFKPRNVNKKMSYTNLRELFIEAIKPHVENVKKYCLHSLRSGGASAAANSGIRDRLFKRHGRWVSENAKDGYVKDNIEERLLVSQSLGI